MCIRLLTGHWGRLARPAPKDDAPLERGKREMITFIGGFLAVGRTVNVKYLPEDPSQFSLMLGSEV